MNILILGLGSIGQRHMRNIDTILKKKVNFYSIRKKYQTPHLSRFNKPLNTDIYKMYNLKNLNSLNDIKKNKIIINAAFICTPTSEHVNSLLWLLKNNINTFIEKPLSNNLNKIEEIQNYLKRSKSITMMGYQMRFDPIINFLKNNNKINKLIGRINIVKIDHGEDVRNFHSWEDYSKSYTSIKHLGGGVTLSQIHEFEYFQYIFSNYNINKSFSIVERVSNLKINVDDTSSHIFLLKNRYNKIVCNLNLNFYETKPNRIIKFVGDNGSLEANLNKKIILINNKSKLKKIKFNYNRNDLFINEVKYFFDLIRRKKIRHDKDIRLGIKNLKFVLKLIK